MRSVLTLTSLVIFNILGLGIFILYVFFSSPIDFIVLNTIPEYPGSSNKTLYASSGFPDGFPDGSISFKTQANAEDVKKFYNNSLIEKGWKEIDLKTISWVGTPTVEDSYVSAYKKKIGLHTFNLEIGKPQKGSNDKEPEVIIFLDHRSKD